jgi:uncharacterized protein (DUF2384 family)
MARGLKVRAGKPPVKEPPAVQNGTKSITVGSIEAHALETFGSQQKAEHWMTRPNPLLQGKTPREVSLFDPSAVEAALVRIDHGVYV